MNPEFIPFDSDEDIPTKRSRLSKDEQIYGVFYSNHSQRPQKTKVKVEKNLNEDELESTYGKGLALMQMCGYKVGDGLGKNNQGTTNLIDVNIRKKNEGLSYSRPENLKSDPPKPVKKTKIDLHEKVIDISDLSDHSEDPETIKITRKQQVLQDDLLSFTYEEKQIHLTLDELSIKETQLQNILSILKSCGESWPEVISAFKAIHKQSYQIYHELFMRENFEIPMIRSYFQGIWDGWKFEKDRLKGIDEIRQWGLVGEIREVIDIWQDPVANFFVNKWKVKNESGSNIDALAVWKAHIPIETWGEISKIILDRLFAEVKCWEPLKDRIAVHAWTHPWLILIDISPLYIKIVQKFALALDQWLPKDTSAKLILKPWQAVLGRHWEDLMTQHILPKLLYFLQEMELSDIANENSCIKHVLEWVGMVPFKELVKGLSSIFLPKWKRKVEQMLEKTGDINQVAEWVNWWKKKIPKELLELDI